MNKQTGFTSYLAENSRPLSSFFYFALIMTIFFSAAPQVFFAPKFHQAVMTTLPIIIFLVIPLVFIVTMGEIDLSFASIFGFAARRTSPGAALLYCFADSFEIRTPSFLLDLCIR